MGIKENTGRKENKGGSRGSSRQTTGLVQTKIKARGGAGAQVNPAANGY
jgi:hypothetical protein